MRLIIYYLKWVKWYFDESWPAIDFGSEATSSLSREDRDVIIQRRHQAWLAREPKRP